jgi:hypothetical protein
MDEQDRQDWCLRGMMKYHFFYFDTFMARELVADTEVGHPVANRSDTASHPVNPVYPCFGLCLACFIRAVCFGGLDERV